MNKEPFSPTFLAKEPFILFAVLLKHYSPIIINLPERELQERLRSHFYVENFGILKKKLSNPDIIYLIYPPL